MAKKLGGGPGEKAGHIPRRFIPDTEVIGPPECPILHRWTLLEFGRKVTEGSSPSRRFKVLLHHFQPNADDRAEHDHPRSFVTIVLRGGYDDRVPCPWCGGENLSTDDEHGTHCHLCVNTGLVTGDRMRAGMIRFRPATYRHVTRVSPRGCWTLVVMGPIRRRWGFWENGRWYFWRDHERLFGFGMRCPEGDD